MCIMSASIEALAMAGVDYVEWGMDVEERERDSLESPPPPHLLADLEQGEEGDWTKGGRPDWVKVFCLCCIPFHPFRRASQYCFKKGGERIDNSWYSRNAIESRKLALNCLMPIILVVNIIFRMSMAAWISMKQITRS